MEEEKKPKEEKKEELRPRCERCDSKFGYARADGSFKCRRCSHITLKK